MTTQKHASKTVLLTFAVLTIGLLVCNDLLAQSSSASVAISDPELAEAIAEQLDSAGENRDAIEEALSSVPENQASTLHFLIGNMPDRDLRSLSSEFLLGHVQIAHAARAQSPWGASVPEEVFLNNVVPYANVNESRDNVRSKLHEQFFPLVVECKSISEAAAKLNHEVFKQLQVKYSTKRRRADQGPQETMDSGIASCTGLSILLIDACRACGIPARFVGTPLWSDRSGNHSWVEIWDQGWHFTGAAEPTGMELDKAWFTGRASKSVVGDRRHGIFAVSYKKTDLPFPLVWQRGSTKPYVFAVEVTDRYVAEKQPMTKSDAISVYFRAFNAEKDRCVADLLVRDASGKIVFRGQTNDESSDANDHLTAQLAPGEYTAELQTTGGKSQTTSFTASGEETLVTVPLERSPIEQLKADLRDELTIDEIAGKSYAALPLSKEQADTAAAMLIETRAQQLRKERLAEHESKSITYGELSMPYSVTVFGDAPESGRTLVISMHGGGGAPKRVNDQQWRNQQRLYQLDEAVYVAPRAPTDTWNLWHQGHIDPMFRRIIENMILFENVDPNRIFITGYSAGGDGVFQLAPRMADQLAGAAMMAGHPNETRPDGLRNLPFTIQMGANDGAYNRNKKAAEWQKSLGELRKADPEGYLHRVDIRKGKGHWMDREDAEGLEWVLQYDRQTYPTQVVWLQDDVLHKRFYWLAVGQDQAKPRAKISATLTANRCVVTECDVSSIKLLLNDKLANLDESLTIEFPDGSQIKRSAKRSLRAIANSIIERYDPACVFTAEVQLELPASPQATSN